MLSENSTPAAHSKSQIPISKLQVIVKLQKSEIQAEPHTKVTKGTKSRILINHFYFAPPNHSGKFSLFVSLVSFV